MLAKVITTWNVILIVQPCLLSLLVVAGQRTQSHPSLLLRASCFLQHSISVVPTLGTYLLLTHPRMTETSVPQGRRLTKGRPLHLSLFHAWLESRLQEQIFKMPQANAVKDSFKNARQMAEASLCPGEVWDGQLSQ